MAIIGIFTKNEDNSYIGEIVTLSLQKVVRIVPETRSNTKDNAPSHRVMIGRTELGAAWAKTSAEGRPYLSLKLDDPSFPTPVYASLAADEGGASYSLIWSRPSGRRND